MEGSSEKKSTTILKIVIRMIFYIGTDYRVVLGAIKKGEYML